MIEIRCIKTKRGKKCLVLVVENVFCSFDESVIIKLARRFDKLADVLSLDIDGYIYLRKE